MVLLNADLFANKKCNQCLFFYFGITHLYNNIFVFHWMETLFSLTLFNVFAFNILAAAYGIVKYIRSHSLIIFVDYSYLYAQGNFSQKYFNDIIISEFLLN